MNSIIAAAFTIRSRSDAPQACGASDLERIVKAAAMIEFIHTATLLHDDVVDNSDSRRGIKTAHQSFGNESTILVGDFLYSRALEYKKSPTKIVDSFPKL